MIAMEAAASGNMGYLPLRQILKHQIRNAAAAANPNPVKAVKDNAKIFSSSSSFFGPSEYSMPERVMEQSTALMPELLKLLANTCGGAVPVIVSKSERVKKLKESRDYSFLLSETAELPNISKGSLPSSKSTTTLVPLKSCGNSKENKGPGNKLKATPKVSQPNRSNLKSLPPRVPKKCVTKANQGHGNKSEPAKPKSSSKDSVPVSGSSLATNSQTSSLSKQGVKALNQKQEKPSNNASQKSPCLKLKQKPMKKPQVEDEDGCNVDYSSLIREIMGTRGKRRYRSLEDSTDDDRDDRSMVSGFNDIQKEEMRSAKIARKEDAIELQRIEQEEKQERLRIAKKQRREPGIEKEEKEDRMKKLKEDLYAQLGL